MGTVVYVPLMAATVLALFAPVVRDRVAPAVAAPALTAAALIVAALQAGALALLAWPLAARVPQLAEIGHWQPADVAGADPVPWAVSVAASIALMVLAARLARLGVAINRQRSEAAAVLISASQRSLDVQGVGIVDDPTPSAYAVHPMSRRQRAGIVITTGLLELLERDEQEAVLAHEQSHLRHRHHGFAFAAAFAAAVAPNLAPIRRDIHHSLERWADEDATRHVERTILLRAISRTALTGLQKSTHARRGTWLAATGLGVAARAQALARPPMVSRRWPLTALTVLVAAGAVTLLVAAHQTERAFESIQHL